MIRTFNLWKLRSFSMYCILSYAISNNYCTRNIKIYKVMNYLRVVVLDNFLLFNEKNIINYACITPVHSLYSIKHFTCNTMFNYLFI